MYKFYRSALDELREAPRSVEFVLLAFELAEAFQFDWSTKYTFVGGLRRRLEVSHMKLCASPAFVLRAYFSQAHDMLFESHGHGFSVLASIAQRGV